MISKKFETIISENVFSNVGELYKNSDDSLVNKFLLYLLIKNGKLYSLNCDGVDISAEELLDCYVVLKYKPITSEILRQIKLYGFSLDEDYPNGYNKIKIGFVKCEDGVMLNQYCEEII